MSFSEQHRYALERYVDRLMAVDAKLGYTGHLYGIDYGHTYAKIWKKDRPGSSYRSVVAFVSYDGTIYRADSWKKRGRVTGHLDSVERDRQRPRYSRAARRSRVRGRRRR